jgi:pilus assembly protein Flp/PilA
MTTALTDLIHRITGRIDGGDESGQGLVEYGLILSLIALVCVLALTTLGSDVSSILSSVAAQL